MSLKGIRRIAIPIILALILLVSGLQVGLNYLSNNDPWNSYRTIGGIPTIKLGTVEASGTVDYVLTGTSDNTVVQAALNALPTSGGKLQFLGIGALSSFGFAATVSRAINNVTVEGVGQASYFTYNGASPIFSVGSQTGWVFKDIATDAGGITQASDTILMNVKLGATLYSFKSATAINANVVGNVTGNASSATSATTATNVSGGTVSATNVTDSALTSGKVPIASTGGLLQDATTIPTGQLGSGTANSSTYLRGDNTWNTPPGGGTGSGTRSVTYMVAASNSTVAEKAGADYTCTGTNDQTTINNAISSAYAGQTVGFCSGTYDIRATITGKSGVSLYSNSGAIFSLLNLSASDNAIEYIGSTSLTQSLTGNATIRDNQVNFTTTSYAAKDLVQLYSAAVWKSNPQGALQGEFFTVNTVSTGHVTLAGTSGVQDSYTTANSAAVRKVTPVKDFFIDGITFTGDGTTLGQICIYIQYGQGFTIRNVTVNDVLLEGIAIWSSIDWTVADCYLNRIKDTGLGYGIAVIDSCENGIISRIHGNNCRHTVALGGSNGDYGIPRNIQIVDCASRDDIAENFNCHEPAEHIDFINCQTFGGSKGIEHDGYSGMIQGCSIFGPYADGINVNNSLSAYGIDIIGNIVENAGGPGIRSSTPYCRISQNKCVKNVSSGIISESNYNQIDHNTIIQPSTSSDASLTILSGTGTRVSKNKMLGANDTGIYVVAGSIGTILDDNESDAGTPIHNSGTGTLKTNTTVGAY